MKILYTGGTFDLFHYGHVNFLKECKKIADRVVVSLNTDDFIRAYKKFDPIMDYSERKSSLLGCRYVDLVVPNIGGYDSKIAIARVNPDIIAIGDDWAEKDYLGQLKCSQEWLDEHGIRLVYIAYTNGISSTELKRRIRSSCL